MSGRPREAVVWHDVECGGYAADLPLWRELAAATGGPVLEVGAGTGRVALDLARRGHDVTALDPDPVLLSELERRAGTLAVRTVAADARELDLDLHFALIAVPMQTIQLLGGAAGRAAFLRRARRHLRPGGRLAAALADPVEPFEASPEHPAPLPDVAEHGGWAYFSQPVAVRHDAGATVIERVRHAVAPGGARSERRDRVRLDALDAAGLAAEGRAAGLRPLAPLRIAATEDHIGSAVVVFAG